MGDMKNPWVAIGVILVVLLGGSVAYSLSVAKTYNEGVVVAPHIKGGTDAKISLVEYSDFQCPACGQFEPIVAEVLAAHGDALKFEYKHFPLIQIHPFAQPAALAAEAAGQQGKFFEYHDMLFAKQEEWSKGTNPAGFFTQYAQALGLDMALFAKHQRSSLLQDAVRASFDEARSKNLTGTPSFFLNGTKMDIKSPDDFKAQIALAINPNANFNVTAGDETLKAVQIEGDTTIAPTEVAPMPPTPAVKFGI